MIDIIIPCYNAYSTLDKTLQSIAVQSIKDKVKVLLVDDFSDNNYDEYIDRYKKYFNIRLLRLDKNSGPGIAREEGINNTSSKYIVFIDSDDLFYSSISLENLFDKIEEGYDIVYSIEFDQKRNDYLVLNGNIHGKIYRRRFIKNKEIHFNNSRYHEDNYFNNLVMLSGAKKCFLEDVTYFYTYNKMSITNNEYNDFDKMELYLMNMNDLLKIANDRDCSKIRISRFLVEKYKYLKRVYNSLDEDRKKIFKGWIKKYDPVLLRFIDLDDLVFINELLLFVFENIDGDN